MNVRGSCPAGTPLPRVVPLLGAAGASAAATLFVPGLLSGPAAMNGSAKGTSFVVLVCAVPLLAVFHRRARHGSLAALTLAGGVTAYLVYNAVLLLFATPLNHAFLLYVAMLGFGLRTLAALTLETWGRGELVTPRVGRWVAGFLLTVVGLNSLAWGSALLPALLSAEPRATLVGTGLTTSPVYVQDLAFWLPTVAWVGVGMWRAHGPRTLLGASVLSFWALESISVAADQWWGHHADPASTVVSANVVPLFIVVGALTLVPLAAVLSAVTTWDQPIGGKLRVPASSGTWGA